MQDNPNIANHVTAYRQKRGFPAAELAHARRHQPPDYLRHRIRQLCAEYRGRTAPGADARSQRGGPLLAPIGHARRCRSPPNRLHCCRIRTTRAPAIPCSFAVWTAALVASSPSPVPWYLPTADAVLLDVPARDRQGRERNGSALHSECNLANRILVAGCDPGISVLARHMLRAGVELVAAQRNSSQALALLKQGIVHVAGTHLRDEASGESNLPAIHRLFARNSVAVISLAVWEEGLVVAPGNPKSIRSIADLARRDVSIVNREPGAGSRVLLDANLARLGLRRQKVRGYDRLAAGHLPAAWRVRAGDADCCMATRAAARVFGLDFIPLASERYDLAIRRQHLDYPPIAMLLDTLNRAAFRRELEGLGGYDTSGAGRRLL